MYLLLKEYATRIKLMTAIKLHNHKLLLKFMKFSIKYNNIWIGLFKGGAFF